MPMQKKSFFNFKSKSTRPALKRSGAKLNLFDSLKPQQETKPDHTTPNQENTTNNTEQISNLEIRQTIQNESPIKITIIE